jgi:hypothetical protein
MARDHDDVRQSRQHSGERFANEAVIVEDCNSNGLGRNQWRHSGMIIQKKALLERA